MSDKLDWGLDAQLEAIIAAGEQAAEREDELRRLLRTLTARLIAGRCRIEVSVPEVERNSTDETVWAKLAAKGYKRPQTRRVIWCEHAGEWGVAIQEPSGQRFPAERLHGMELLYVSTCVVPCLLKALRAEAEELAADASEAVKALTRFVAGGGA